MGGQDAHPTKVITVVNHYPHFSQALRPLLPKSQPSLDFERLDTARIIIVLSLGIFCQVQAT
jgi:hypothetical protein